MALFFACTPKVKNSETEGTSIEDAKQIRENYLQEMAMKNAAGSMAADFRLEYPDGRCGRLSDHKGKSLVLIFYDPECVHCGEIIHQLDASRCLQGMSVLAVYTEGNEDVWRTTLTEMPADWKVAIDRDSIVDKAIYDIPVMPMIYLLDAQQQVVEKDSQRFY